VWRLLAALGCDQGQGYFMSRAIPGDQLAQWISNWKAPQNAPVEFPDTVF
jgi:EAL domain-containing protein (putative c-di-GMP-specific phosphodiesterase class I)